jgi:predicted unusual protein kinase regulating ubiquinone biosynthesis (AarF/ABC1/UbiB family)
LYFLNKNKIGFAHRDLHGNNLLVDEDTLDFKLFDFDLSETFNHINDSFYDRISESNNKETLQLVKNIKNFKYENRKKFEFYYDIIRLFCSTIYLNLFNERLNKLLNKLSSNISYDEDFYDFFDIYMYYANLLYKDNIFQKELLLYVKNIDKYHKLNGGNINYQNKYIKYKYKYLNLH